MSIDLDKHSTPDMVQKALDTTATIIQSNDAIKETTELSAIKVYWESKNKKWSIIRDEYGYGISNGWFVDRPIIYADKSVAYSNPEALPKYVKNKFARIAKRLNDTLCKICGKPCIKRAGRYYCQNRICQLYMLPQDSFELCHCNNCQETCDYRKFDRRAGCIKMKPCYMPLHKKEAKTDG